MLYSKMQNSTSESIVFHKPRKTMIGIQKDKKLILYHNLANEIQEENPFKRL